MREEYIDICRANGGILISTDNSEGQAYELVKQTVKEVMQNENI